MTDLALIETGSAVLEFDSVEYAVFVIGGFNKAIRNRGVCLFLFVRLCGNVGNLGVFLADLTVLRIENDCVEFASALAYCDHTVGYEGVIEDRIAFVKDVNVTSDLNF